MNSQVVPSSSLLISEADMRRNVFNGNELSIVVLTPACEVYHAPAAACLPAFADINT
jgi:hypothetical protein